MVKSRKVIKKNVKTKRVKRGGRKNENYNPIAITQMQGGQEGGVAPAPAPSDGLNIYNMDGVSLQSSLQSFGDAVYAFVATAQTDVDTFKTPNIPTTGVAAGTLYALLLEQKTSSINLQNSANAVMSAFYNTNSTASNGIPAGGIYRAIYGPSAIFVATPIPGSPRPAPAVSGGYNHDGGVNPAPAPPSGNGINIASPENLRAALQAFGNKLAAFKISAESQVTQVASPDLTDFQATAGNSGPAYSAFLAQKSAATNLVSAAASVMTAFAGSPGPYDGVNGTRGLYRAIIGNTANFVVTV